MEKKREPLHYRPVAEADGKLWRDVGGLDEMKDAGCYIVQLRHGPESNQLPLEPCDDEHYIVATLIVTESGTADTLQKNRMIGQTLIMPDCGDGCTRIFNRTLKSANKNSTWNSWNNIAQTGVDNEITSTEELVASVTELIAETKNIKTNLALEVVRTQEAEAAITKDAILSGSLNVNQDTDSVTLAYLNIKGTETPEVEIPAATTESAGVMSAEDKRLLGTTTSKLGFSDETITLTLAELKPMVWDGTKMVASTVYSTWVIPLYNGRRYACKKYSFIQSIRVCNKRPMLEENITMTAAIGLETGTFVATEDTRYLVIAVFITDPDIDGLAAYDGSNYVVSAFKSGLIEGVEKIEDNLEKVTAGFENSDSITKRLAREVNVCLGTKDRTIVLTSDNYDGLMWNGTTFQAATSAYNGFVLPIYPGERIKYIDDSGANNVCTLTEYPTEGSCSRLRTRTDLKGDFIVKDNEHYLFLNTTASIFTSYKVIAGDGSIREQIDTLKQQMLPLFGKTIVCFGDSITEFSSNEGKGWCDYFATMSGANVVRAGVGGTQLATRKAVVEVPSDYLEAYGAVDISNLVKAWATKDWTAVDNAVAWLASNKNDDNSMQIERLKAIPIENVDIVIVFGGTNDMANATFGSPTDTNPVLNTCGGINQIIDSILTVKSDVAIYFITPMPRNAPDGIWCDEYRLNEKDAAGREVSYPALVERIKECTRHNHVPCCDMFNAIGINRKNLLTYAPDGVHPKNGYSLVANRIYGFLLANRIWQ